MTFKEQYGVDLPGLQSVDEQENPTIVAHFTHKPYGFEWYIVAGDEYPNGDVLMFGLVNAIALEFGEFTLSSLKQIGAKKDENWIPKGMYNIYNKLQIGGK